MKPTCPSLRLLTSLVVTSSIAGVASGDTILNLDKAFSTNPPVADIYLYTNATGKAWTINGNVAVGSGSGADSRLFVGVRWDASNFGNGVLTLQGNGDAVADTLTLNGYHPADPIIGRLGHVSSGNFTATLNIDGSLGVTMGGRKIRYDGAGTNTINVVNGSVNYTTSGFGWTEGTEGSRVNHVIGANGSLILPGVITNIAEFQAWAVSSGPGVEGADFDLSASAGRFLNFSNDGTKTTVATVPLTVATWDTAPGGVGVGDSTITGGTGSWDTTFGNWTTDGGANNIAWTNGGNVTAVFGGTAGSVTLVSNIVAGGMSFSSSGYLIGADAGNTLTLAAPTIGVANGGDMATISAPLAGSAGLAKTGAGSLVISGANTYTGTTTISGGTLTIGGAGQLGGGSYAGAISNNGSLVFNSSSAQTFSGQISGSGGLTQNGSGTLTLSNAVETYSGNTAVNAGTLALSGSAAINNSPAITIASGATLSLGGSGNNQIQGGQPASSSLVINGTLDAPTAGTAHTLYTGSITLTNGTISGAVGHATFGLFYANGNRTITCNGANNVISCGNFGIDRAAANVVLTLNTPLATDALSASTSFIDGNTGSNHGGLAKSGLGTVTLSGISTHTGSTTVSGGTLIVDGELSNSATIVNSGTTLSGAGTVRSATVSGNLTPGGSSIDTLTITDALVFNASSKTTCQINKTGAALGNDQLFVGSVAYAGTLEVVATGDALILGDTFRLFDSLSYSGSFGTFTLPALTGGLSWDLSKLGTTGEISVSNKADIPSFIPGEGTFIAPQAVTMNSGSGTTVYYTFASGGAEPPNPTISSASGTPGSGTATVNLPSVGTWKVKAMATKAGLINSDVALGTFTLIPTPRWITAANGYWSDLPVDAVNWQDGLVGNGSGIPADFSTVTLAADTTVTLDGDRTIGSLLFADGGNQFDWTLDGSSQLTLAGTAPSIAVGNQSATVATALAGSQGLVKTGPGALVLTGFNTYGGGTSINGGTLQIGNGVTNGTIGSGSYAIGSGANLTLNYATATTPPWANVTGTGTFELNSAQPVTGVANWGAVGLTAGFTGTLKIDKGRINSAPAGFGGATSLVIGDGAQFLGYDGTNGGVAHSFAQNISINGMGWGETGLNFGALRVSGMKATFTGNISLTGNSGLFTQTGQSNSEIIVAGSIGDGGAGYGLAIQASAKPVTLAGGNTYGGGTTVNAGTLFVTNTTGSATGSGAVTVNSGTTLGGTGSIGGAVTINSGANVNPGIDGIGTLTVASATMNGAYQCDLDAVTSDSIHVTGSLTVSGTTTLTFNGTPTASSYVLASYGSLVGTLPTITAPAGYQVVDDATNKQIKLVKAAGYSGWADSWPGLTDKTQGGDPDGDGLTNLMEYVLGGDPRSSSSSVMPKQAIVGANLVISYKRSDDSKTDTTQMGQWSTDLGTWNNVTPVLVNDNASAPDDMEIRIPLANELGGKLFGRLKVTSP